MKAETMSSLVGMADRTQFHILCCVCGRVVLPFVTCRRATCSTYAGELCHSAIVSGVTIA